MPLAVVPSSLLLPLEILRLGRFVTSIDQPLEGYHQPPFAIPPTEIVSKLDYAIRRRKIYMIVGFCTMTDTQFVQTSAREQGTQGQATAPVSLSLAEAGAVVPFAGLVDPSIQGGSASFVSNETRIFAPGEQICTIKYREVKYKWLSSRTLKN
jgi:hypothetical protein